MERSSGGRPGQGLGRWWALALAVSLATGRLYAQLRLPEERVVVASVLGVNSAGPDFAPVWYDSALVYVSTRGGDLRRRLRRGRGRKADRTRLFAARPGSAEAPEAFLPGLSRDVNAGPLTFSADGRVAYVTRNAEAGRGRGRARARPQIYEVVREGEAWGAPAPVAFADGTSNDAHPALAPDGSYLVFVSDRDGGFGGLDLWIVERVGETWGAPRNLGPDVNTGGNEGFPYVHPDGTVYYATTVPGESGRPDHLDIVYTRPAGGDWTAPTALGPPFNTPADDFGLVVDDGNARGYFASSRAGGLGDDDVYAFEVVGAGETTPTLELAVAVTDASTGEPLRGASVRYLSADTTSLATALEVGIVSADGAPLRVVGGERYVTDVGGRGVIGLPRGRYLIEVEREGYQSVQLTTEVGARGTSLPVALAPEVACAEVDVSVLGEASLRPVADATVVATAIGRAGEEVTRVATGEGGVAAACLPCGGIYAIAATSGARASTSTSLDLRGEACGRTRRTTVTVYLGDGASSSRRPVAEAGTPLVPGTQFQLPSVFYATGAWRLSAAATAELDDLARLMRRFPEMRVLLGSHTDATGSAALNRGLSQRRADEARRYLLQEAGIEPERLVAVGYGESQLSNGCRDGVACSPAQHRENRRTEVTILGEGVSVTYPPPLPTAPAPAERVERPSYLVVASTHAADDDAEEAAARVREFGYGGVRVTPVPGVAGVAVVAGQFGTLAEATQFARALSEAHGIGAYVRRVTQ